jgi:dihydroflavonol-4-reductase
MTVIDPGAPVLVTGGGGYVASWIVRYLLEDGYNVRATVRNPAKPRGLDHLHALSAAHPGKLTLYAADLLDEGSFTSAMDGCELVVHTASPFLLGKTKDPEAQFVRPAVQGTRNVLSGVNATDSVKRVVLTSSVAAVYGDNADMQGKQCFTENGWNTTSSVDHQPYAYSKTVAERAAWDIQAAQERWDLVTVHPGLVLGPSLTTASHSGSMTTMRHFTDYSMAAGAPALQIGVVDVRDVARVHIKAGFTPEARGRYITVAETTSLLEISTILAGAFGRRLSFPRIELPKILVKLGAPLAGLTGEYVDRNVGWPLAFDNTRTVRALEVRFRPAAESVIEHFQQMIDDGLAKA